MESHNFKEGPGAALKVLLCSPGASLEGTRRLRLIRLAVHESTYLVFGVVSDPTLVDAMRVSWLAGVRDS